MNRLLRLLALLALLGTATGCMRLSVEALCQKPVLAGRGIESPHRFVNAFQARERQFFLFGLIPLGREIHESIRPYTKSHDGIARLRLTQVMRPLDCLITAATLGIVSAVSIEIEGYHFIYVQPG